MGNGAVRGTRLGATSYESDAGVDFASRQMTTYDCPAGHVDDAALLRRGRDPLRLGVRRLREARPPAQRRRAGAPAGEARARPTGTCCSSVARSPSSKRSSRSVSTRSARTRRRSLRAELRSAAHGPEPGRAVPRHRLSTMPSVGGQHRGAAPHRRCGQPSRSGLLVAGRLASQPCGSASGAPARLRRAPSSSGTAWPCEGGLTKAGLGRVRLYAAGGGRLTSP